MYNPGQGHSSAFTDRSRHRPQSLHPQGLVRSPYASMDIDNRDDEEAEGDPDGDVSYWDQSSVAYREDRTRQQISRPPPRQNAPASSSMGLWSTPAAQNPQSNGGRARPSSNFNPRPANPRGYESDRPAGSSQSTLTNSMLLNNLIKRQNDQDDKIDGVLKTLGDIKTLLTSNFQNNLEVGAASDPGVSRKGPAKSTKPKDKEAVKEVALRDTVREGVTSVLGVTNTTNPPPPLPNGPDGKPEYLLLDPRDINGKTTVVRPDFDRSFWDQTEWHPILIEHLRKNGSSSMTKLELEEYSDKQILEKTAACVWKTMVSNWKKRDRPTEAAQQKARATQRATRKAATLGEVLQSVHDLRGKVYQALTQPQVQSGEETDPGTGIDGIPKVLKVREPTWRAPWVNRFARGVAKKNASRLAKGKSTSGSVTTHQRIRGEPIEVELPDLTAAGFKIPRSAIDDDWLRSHPLRGDARDLVDWMVTKIPDLSDFLATNPLAEPNKQEEHHEPGLSYGLEEYGPSSGAGTADVFGAESAPQAARALEPVHAHDPIPRPLQPNHAVQPPLLGMEPYIPGAPVPVLPPRPEPQLQAASANRSAPSQHWELPIDPAMLNNPGGISNGHDTPPTANHPLAYQVEATANNPFGIPGVHVMPPPPVPMTSAHQAGPSHLGAASQLHTSDPEGIDMVEMLNNDGVDTSAETSRGRARGRRGGRARGSRGRGGRGRGDGGAVSGVNAASGGVSTRRQKKKADEIADMLSNEESESAANNSVKRTRHAK